jgi:hypothetical protein
VWLPDIEDGGEVLDRINRIDGIFRKAENQFA